MWSVKFEAIRCDCEWAVRLMLVAAQIREKSITSIDSTRMSDAPH